MTHRILLLDPDPLLARTLSRRFQAVGCSLTVIPSPAVLSSVAVLPDLAILNYDLGIGETLARLRPPTLIIVITETPDAALHDLRGQRVHRLVAQPVVPRDLVALALMLLAAAVL